MVKWGGRGPREGLAGDNESVYYNVMTMSTSDSTSVSLSLSIDTTVINTCNLKLKVIM